MTGTALVLNPAARLLWRSAASVQLELGTNAVVLAGIDVALVRRLVGLDPTRSGDPPVAAGLPPAAVTELSRRGFLVPAPPSDPLDAVTCAPTGRAVPRLASDLAALQLRHGEAAARIAAGRRAATVTVLGTGRLTAVTAGLFAAAGVGTVHAPGTGARGRRGDVRVSDPAPGGFVPADEGRPMSEALADVVHRAAPEARTGVRETPDLTVLVGDDPYADPVESEVVAALQAANAAHLVVRAGGDLGIVGPLVLPGVTGCLACADRHRRDRDPSWSTLAVQLSVPRRGSVPLDVALCEFVAGLACLQALAWLAGEDGEDGVDPAVDGDGTVLGVLGGTLEMRLPGWRVRRRSWPPHPKCGCGAAAGGVRPAPAPLVAPDSAQWPA